MWARLNASDILLVTFSSFVFIWGANRLLRNIGMPDYQA